ncbi:hypothetical protein DSM107010_69810 [Chroococcidiopsis cubana SAG 39.79]|uniref:Uncharacterized protein n=1 Tax=Chroococcidiopsis cubana SAG 39.79 TaxID=388085 RepID=A0AB37U8Y6_9CYAN|nr:hypothetical protein DSM107010_69810 [Chroococcidiopsis cubana SAG 39.79]
MDDQEYTKARQTTASACDIQSANAQSVICCGNWVTAYNQIAKLSRGKHHPDRDTQFQYISQVVQQFQQRQQPVISVDAKKKELIGEYKNVGQEWQPAGQPAPVKMHDFADRELGKVIPYGVYDLYHNQGWVTVGVDHDTAQLAVAAIRQ